MQSACCHLDLSTTYDNCEHKHGITHNWTRTFLLVTEDLVLWSCVPDRNSHILPLAHPVQSSKAPTFSDVAISTLSRYFSFLQARPETGHPDEQSTARECALVIYFRGTARNEGMTLSVTSGAYTLLLSELPKCCQPLDVLTGF